MSWTSRTSWPEPKWRIVDLFNWTNLTYLKILYFYSDSMKWLFFSEVMLIGKV